MANPNQQLSRIISAEQYEQNNVRIAQMRAYLQAYETQNELGHDEYINLQQELTKRIREGEQAQRMLMAMQQQSSAISYTRPQSSVSTQQISKLFSTQNQQLPTTATIEEIGSDYSSPSFQRSSGTTLDTRGAFGAPGSMGYHSYPNQSPTQNQHPPYPAETHRMYDLNTNVQHDGRPYNRTMQPTMSSATGTYVHTNIMPQTFSTSNPTAVDKPISNLLRQSTTRKVAPSTTSFGTVNKGATPSPVQLRIDQMRQAYDNICRTLESYEAKDIEESLSQMVSVPAESIQGNVIVTAISTQLQRFSPQEAREVLFYVRQRYKQTFSTRNASVSQEPTNSQATSATHSLPASSSQHTTLHFTSSESSGQKNILTVETETEVTSSTPTPRTEAEVLKKLKAQLKEIFLRMQTEGKSTKQVARFVTLLHEATYARTNSEDPLVTWAIESLQSIPPAVIRKGLTVVMEQMSGSTPRMPRDGTSVETTTAFSAIQPLQPSTSSLAGALILPNQESFAAKKNSVDMTTPVVQPSPVKLSNGTGNPTQPSINGSTGSQVPTGPVNLSGTFSRFSVRSTTRSPALTAPSQTSIFKAPFSTFVYSEAALGSHHSFASTPITSTQVDRSNLAKDILKELGMPTGSMPPLMTDKEAKREKRRRWTEHILELNASHQQSTFELAQAITDSQSTQDTLGGTSNQNLLSSRTDLQPTQVPLRSPLYVQSEPQQVVPSTQVPASDLNSSKIVESNAGNNGHLPRSSDIQQTLTQPVTSKSLQGARTSSRTSLAPNTPPAEPLFLASDSEPDDPMMIDHNISEVDQYLPLQGDPRATLPRTANSSTKDLKSNAGVELTSVIEQPRSNTSIAPSTARSNGIPLTESRSNIGDSLKRPLKKSRFYIEIPPLPARATRKRKVKELYEETNDEEEEGFENPAIQEALDEVFSRMKSCACNWRGCNIVLNCINTLCKHLILHVHDREGSKNFKCHWRNCRRRFGSLALLEHHVLSSHAKRPIFCARKDCKESFDKPHDLHSHNLAKHKPGDLLKRSALPSTYNGQYPQEELPSSMLTYLMIPVAQTPIPADRHAKLGPWVLRQIYGPINTTQLRYNAATPLRNSRRLDRSNEQAEQPGIFVRSLRPDKYDFLDSRTFDSRVRGFLPNAEVSDSIASGVVFMWEKGKGEPDKRAIVELGDGPSLRSARGDIGS